MLFNKNLKKIMYISAVLGVGIPNGFTMEDGNNMENDNQMQHEMLQEPQVAQETVKIYDKQITLDSAEFAKMNITELSEYLKYYLGGIDYRDDPNRAEIDKLSQFIDQQLKSDDPIMHGVKMRYLENFFVENYNVEDRTKKLQDGKYLNLKTVSSLDQTELGQFMHTESDGSSDNDKIDHYLGDIFFRNTAYYNYLTTKSAMENIINNTVNIVKDTQEVTCKYGTSYDDLLSIPISHLYNLMSACLGLCHAKDQDATTKINDLKDFINTLFANDIIGEKNTSHQHIKEVLTEISLGILSFEFCPENLRKVNMCINNNYIEVSLDAHSLNKMDDQTFLCVMTTLKEKQNNIGDQYNQYVKNILDKEDAIFKPMQDLLNAIEERYKILNDDKSSGMRYNDNNKYKDKTQMGDKNIENDIQDVYIQDVNEDKIQDARGRKILVSTINNFLADWVDTKTFDDLGRNIYNLFIDEHNKKIFDKFFLKNKNGYQLAYCMSSVIQYAQFELNRQKTLYADQFIQDTETSDKLQNKLVNLERNSGQRQLFSKDDNSNNINFIPTNMKGGASDEYIEGDIVNDNFGDSDDDNDNKTHGNSISNKDNNQNRKGKLFLTNVYQSKAKPSTIPTNTNNRRKVNNKIRLSMPRPNSIRYNSHPLKYKNIEKLSSTIKRLDISTLKGPI